MKKLIFRLFGIKMLAKSRLKPAQRTESVKKQNRLANGRYCTKKPVSATKEARTIPVNYMGKVICQITL